MQAGYLTMKGDKNGIENQPAESGTVPESAWERWMRPFQAQVQADS
jgi:hypothetical protein